ncbi:hypothetical protein U14_02370 [Candidatus Moduliflexus flocculans]|uniref:Uncharacterized protein n=1 Tax=Candidatus Moduliflexus flocculans TaxID=1499966 RepID=A0A0S6VU82_9BACT|nr:hypothetical protein U14_02370 [Candidatus Moduliflexus flocculans]
MRLTEDLPIISLYFYNYLGVPKLTLAARRSRAKENAISLIRAAKASFGTPES